jgi:hypothetical protein
MHTCVQKYWNAILTLTRKQNRENTDCAFMHAWPAKSAPRVYTSSKICWNIPLYANICWNMPFYTSLHMYTKICWHIALYTSLCQNLLKYTSLHISVYAQNMLNKPAYTLCTSLYPNLLKYTSRLLSVLMVHLFEVHRFFSHCCMKPHAKHWGQCYDHSFWKIAFFLKDNVMIIFS